MYNLTGDVIDIGSDDKQIESENGFSGKEVIQRTF